MRSYIIQSLTKADKERLRSAGVRFSDWVDGILIDETELAAFFLLEKVTVFSEEPTEYQGIFKLSVSKPVSNTRTVERSNTARNNYVKLYAQRHVAAREAAIDGFAELKGQLATAQDYLAARTRQDFVADNKWNNEVLGERFKEQCRTIAALDQVEAVRFGHGNLYVYTHTLSASCPDTGDRHELGRFLIILNLDGTAGGAQWHNLTGTRTFGEGVCLQAPRINADGSAFADEACETLLELIAVFEFATAVEIAIQFVETVCADERRKFIQHWPKL